MKIRKISIISIVVAMMFMMTSAFAFAGSDDFKLDSSYPKNGQTNTTLENMSIKLKFNKELGSKEYEKENSKCFKIVDSKGKKLPIGVYYNPKNHNEVLVLVKMNKIKKLQKKGEVLIKDKSKYTLEISSNLKNNDGEKLGKNEKISFTTLNQSWNRKVYMIMMAVMMVAMFGFMAFEAKKKKEKEGVDEKEEPFNPYKEAKKSGKSVEEVMAKREKEVAKKKSKLEKKKPKEDDEEYEEELPEGHYKVAKIKRVSEAGSNYKTGRKALAEERKLEEERLAKRRAKNKKKGKK